MTCTHHARQRDRFRRLAQSRARAGAERRQTSRCDVDRRGDAPDLFDARQAPPLESPPAAPSTSRPTSSISPNPRSCTAIPNASPCSIACCGGCGSNHDLIDVATDPDVAQIAEMAKAVHRDEHKMHAFVRFREIGREPKSHFVAWFEPAHHIVELAAPFFARRFADMAWSILTPDVCAHWDGHAVSITPGVAQGRGAVRRPARRNLAHLLRQHLQSGAAQDQGDAARDAEEILEESAGSRADRAADRKAPSAPPRDDRGGRDRRQAQPQKRRRRRCAKTDRIAPETSRRLREEAADCRACPLWKDATQTVFGEGPQTARI